MKNAGKAIRTAYYNALNGITYNSNTVTVYDDLPIGTLPDQYVYINDITEAGTDNNQQFVSDVVVTLDVVVRQYKKVDRDTVDGIAEVVCNTLLPTVTGLVLTETNFQIINLLRDGFQYLNDYDGDYHIVRKIMRFRQTLIEK